MHAMTLVCQPHHFVAPARRVEDPRGGPARLAMGQNVVAGEETLVCGEPAGAVAVTDVLAAVEAFDALTGGTWSPPLAAVLYRLTGQPAFLDRFFPLAGALDLAERAAFYEQVARVGRDPGLDLRLIGEDRADLTARLPEDARAIVASHLVEIFFYRRDLLASFLARPRHIFLYATPRAFAQDGGVAGGDYDPAQERLQLGLSRLYEGFYGEIPGVAPLIHELGHMLDCMVVGGGREERCAGLLPGMRPADGDLYTPRARSLFLAGKRLELERYRRRQRGDVSDAPPVGHPYVFQTDGEFVAGFLELFFRTPHYLAGQNPALFDALAALFSQDPRRGRERDFAFYVDENRKAYAPGHPPIPDPGIRIPAG
jgi:hypothetical protein